LVTIAGLWVLTQHIPKNKQAGVPTSQPTNSIIFHEKNLMQHSCNFIKEQLPTKK
jgi:hypothetical protein